MPSGAYGSFLELKEHCDNLVAIHGQARQGRGRRHRTEALHRAGVTLTIGAWEGYVESVLLELVTFVDAQNYGAAAPGWARSSFHVFSTTVTYQVNQLHTPNAENIRRLFQSTVGFDPWPHWTWISHGRNWNTRYTRTRMNEWLRIRHAVAHGGQLPTNIDWIQAANGTPRLTLNELKACIAFFDRMAARTDEALSRFSVAAFGITAPW